MNFFLFINLTKNSNQHLKIQLKLYYEILFTKIHVLSLDTFFYVKPCYTIET